MPQLYYNERPLSDFDIYIFEKGTYNSPERSVTEQAIPGRNGTLVLDNGRFNNIEVVYQGIIVDDFEVNIEAARNFLASQQGYVKIRDSYRPDEYRLGVYSSGLDVKVSSSGSKYGKFNIRFNCKPQRFLVDGDVPITMSSGDTLTNPTLFPSRPLIHVVGTGTVSVNDIEMTISGSQEYTDIDCDLMDCYAEGVNLNKFVSIDGDEFPELVPGENILVYDGPSAVQITPRWWII